MKWLTNIKRMLFLENAKNLSDKELERCLKPCIAGEKLIFLAKKYRDLGCLKL